MKNKWFLWLVAILIGAALAFSPATFAAEKGEKADRPLFTSNFLPAY